jgi:hypothetical protein
MSLQSPTTPIVGEDGKEHTRVIFFPFSDGIYGFFDFQWRHLLPRVMEVGLSAGFPPPGK